jgi:hypothetical protein
MWSGSYSRKIQLWSDSHEKEFAVKLSDQADFKAVSNPTAKYTKLVDEAEYFSDLEYDWQFLLSHWAGVRDGSIKLLDNEGKKPGAVPFELTDALAPIKKQEKRARREKPRPPLNCRFCKLSYNTEKERREHELAWHSDKMKGPGQADTK